MIGYVILFICYWMMLGMFAQIIGVFSDHFLYGRSFHYSFGNICEKEVIRTALLLGPVTLLILSISIAQGIGYKWNSKRKGR